MAWRVVIAGGGFGGLYAARRLERRLPHHSAQVTLVDWTVALFFRRSSSELGQLGHPPTLAAEAMPGEITGSG